MEEIQEKINRLRQKKDVIILAHYYTDGAVQDIADEVGDSYYLSKKAIESPQKNILFCGVSFMGESAKIMNPKKRVFMAEAQADCPMAHMAKVAQVTKMRQSVTDLCVVCYINSTAELKAASDVCVTSSNAVKIISQVLQKNIYFIPDQNLGRFIAGQLPEKNFIFNDGYCHVHQAITKDNVLLAKQTHPQALVLVHPECTPDVVAIADYTGSTLELVEYTKKSEAKEFIIGTELGVLHQMQKKSPQKKFYGVSKEQYCPDMKSITLEKVARVLEEFSNEVLIAQSSRLGALGTLQQMHVLAEKG